MPEKTLTEVFTDIADAIRGKTGGAEPIAALDMATAISEIPSGPDLPFSSISFVKMGPQGDIYGYTETSGWYHYTNGSDQAWPDHSLSSGSTFWINPLDSDNAEALEQGSIYYIGTQASEAPAIINLTTDSVYQYGGDNSFEPVDFPYQSGIYSYDADLKEFFPEQNVSDECGLYYYGSSTPHFSPATGGNLFWASTTYENWGALTVNNDSVYQAHIDGEESVTLDPVEFPSAEGIYRYSNNRFASAMWEGGIPEESDYYYWDTDSKYFRESGLSDGNLYIYNDHSLESLSDGILDENKTYTLAYNNDDGHWTITEN